MAVVETMACSFLWAACEGSLTVATVLVLWDCKATLKRPGLLVDCASCVDEKQECEHFV